MDKEIKLTRKNCKCGNELTDTIPTIFADRLCRACLEKQLKQKEQECEDFREKCKWYDHYKDSALSHTDRINNKYLPQIDALQKQVDELLESLKPFQDKYFKDLSMESIAELAKKATRMTKHNIELESDKALAIEALEKISNTKISQEKYIGNAVSLSKVIFTATQTLEKLKGE